MAQRPSTGNWHSNRAKGSSLEREHYLKNLNPHPAREEVFHSLSAPRSGMGMPTEPQNPPRPASSCPRSCVGMPTKPQTPPRPAPRSHAPAWECIPSRKAHRALPLVPTLLRGNAYQATNPSAPCFLVPTLLRGNAYQAAKPTAPCFLVPTLLRGNAYQAAKPTAPCFLVPTLLRGNAYRAPHTHQPHYHWRHTSNKPATLA